MHIPDGLLSERVFLPLDVLTIGAVAYASARTRRDLEERPGVLPLTGVMGAFIFAAQMVNIPVNLLAGVGVSGHLLGGVLASILLGPYCATLAMAAVFIIQAPLGDGGVWALGPNIFNMGLIGTFLGYGVFRALRGTLPARIGLEAAAFAASFVAVVVAAFAAYIEIAASRPEYRGPSFLRLMVGYHAAIGLLEGAVTVGVLTYIRRVRPDLVAADGAPALGGPRPSPWPLAIQMLIAAATVGFVLARFASESPDGLQATYPEVRAIEEAGAAKRPPPER